MTPKSLLLAFVGVFVGTVSASGASAMQTAVPVHEEPRHRLVFEAGDLRVLDVQIQPGDTTLYHIHSQPIFYTFVASSAVASQRLGGDWSAPGRSSPRVSVARVSSNPGYAERPLTHRVTNVGERLFRIIAITNDGPGATTPDDRRAEGADGAEVVNPWFRAYRITLPPKETGARHSHASPVVVVQATPGQYQITEEGRLAGEGNGLGSFSVLAAGVEHELQNPGNSEVQLMEVEVRER